MLKNLFEGSARKLFRKWDNVKRISEKISKSPRARAVYGAGLWGLMVRSKERLDEKSGQYSGDTIKFLGYPKLIRFSQNFLGSDIRVCI